MTVGRKAREDVTLRLNSVASSKFRFQSVSYGN